MGTYSWTTLTWTTGDYITEAKANNMTDNDGYLRERTDFDNMPIGVPPELTGLSNPSSSWGFRITMDGTSIDTWTHLGGSASFTRENVSLTGIAEGATDFVLEAGESGGSGTYHTIASFKFYKKQDMAYASVWFDVVTSQTAIAASDLGIIVHRESKTW